MRYGRKFIATILALLMCSTSVFAEEKMAKTFQATTDGKNISVIETDLHSDVDNSNLPVKVMKQTGLQLTKVYEGLLGGYDNGAWIHTDFSKINFMLIIDWESENNDVIYIIPIAEESEDNSDITDVDKTTQKENTAESSNKNQNSNDGIMTAEIIQPSLNIQEHFYVNDTEITSNHVQQTIMANDELLAEYIITNNGTNAQAVQLILCIYSPNGRLLNMSISSGNIAVGETKTISRSMTVAGDVTACYAKVMLWDGLNSLRPLHNILQIGANGNAIETATALVNCVANKEYNLVVTAENIPENDNDVYTISYEPSKLELIDLCSLTYKKELTAGTIAGTDINIISVDTTNGEIKFENPSTSTQNISKVLNSIKFKGLISDETTMITIE